jgi:hypothetical protein
MQNSLALANFQRRKFGARRWIPAASSLIDRMRRMASPNNLLPWRMERWGKNSLVGPSMDRPSKSLDARDQQQKFSVK